MASETVSSSRAEKQQPEAKKSSTKNIIIYALIAVGGVLLCGILYWGYRKYSSFTEKAPANLFLHPIKFPESSDSKCDYYTLYEIKDEPHVESSVKTPTDTLNALTSSNFESFRVLGKDSAIAPAYASVFSAKQGYANIYPHDTSFAPYRIKWDSTKPYKCLLRRYHLGLIKWNTEGATTFTIFNYLTKEMRDYQFKPKECNIFHLIPSLDVVVTEAFNSRLIQVISLKDGKCVLEGSALDGVSRLSDSDYFTKKDSKEKNRSSPWSMAR